MINGIQPEPSIEDFDSAMDRLVENIDKDYKGWKTRSKYDDMPGAFPDVDIKIKSGRKFIKIIRENSVWGFVAYSDGMHQPNILVVIYLMTIKIILIGLDQIIYKKRLDTSIKRSVYLHR